MKETLPVFFSRMAPSHFLTIQDIHMEMPLSAVENGILLCVSAIGSPDAFVKCIEKVSSFPPIHSHVPFYVPCAFVTGVSFVILYDNMYSVMSFTAAAQTRAC